jgi:hypothetical protein
MTPAALSAYGRRTMDASAIAFPIAFLLFLGVLFLSMRKMFLVDASLDTWAQELGLRRDEEVLEGVIRSVPVRIALEWEDTDSEARRILVVSADIPWELPESFTAAPRRTTTWFEQNLAEDLIRSGNAALDGEFFFQSGEPEKGQRLVEDPRVQRALGRLIVPPKAGYVKKGRTHLAYRDVGRSTEQLRKDLDAVVDAALVFAEVCSHLDSTSRKKPPG